MKSNRHKRGMAFIEYFVLVAACAAAAWWLYDNGEYWGFREQLRNLIINHGSAPAGG